MASESTFMFVGSFVHSLSPKKIEFVHEGALVVSGKKIVHFQKNPKNLAEVQKQYKVADSDVRTLSSGQFLIPGFIDTHIHGPQYPNVGLGYDLPLLDWLRTHTFPLETKFSDEKYAERVYNAVVKKCLGSGTTTAVYFATIHKNSSLTFVNCVKSFGQRAFVGKVTMNKNSPPEYRETSEGAIADAREFVTSVLALNNELIKPIISPRFALTCDSTVMTALGKLAAEFDLLIQTHMSENQDEVKLVKQEFPGFRNYLDVYVKAGLVKEKTILAHGVFLEPEEISEIKKKKATVSHCAASNTLLLSGICPVRRYLDSGVKMSLGTDCSAGNSCSMLDCMRQTLFLSIHAGFANFGEKLSVEEVFYMATQGGAEAVNLGKVIGNFAVGKEFDALLVDLENSSMDLLEDYTLSQKFQKFIYTGDDRSIKNVYVAGKLVKSNF